MTQRLRHIGDWINSHYGASVGWTIVLLSLWQLLVAMFGVDLCDTGYYHTFFDNIFKAPASVEYNFMYYLSGLAGGAISSLLPAGGKWMAMRAAGVLCNVAVMVLLAATLRRIVPATAVILGFLMVVASLVQFPYTFNNDLMSALLWVAALVPLYHGLTCGKRRYLLLAGIIVGMNTFTRIPNVLAVGLAVMPFIARIHDKRPWKQCWAQCGIMLAGVATGTLLLVITMLALGHWDTFVQNMTDLVGVATGSSGEASHNAGGLVMAMLDFYKQCLIVGIKAFGLWWAFWAIRRYVNHILLRTVAWLVTAAMLVFFMWHQSHIMHPLWVMCVAGLILVIARAGGGKAIAGWLGLFMLLAFPLGSDGATNNGGIIAWVAAPMAALLWQRRANIVFPLAFIAVGFVQTVTVGAYFDGGPLWQKTATIDSPQAALIHTTPERARIINSTLPALKARVAPGDTMLCYGSIPMMNHLTGTVPAIGCSWPELLSTAALTARLDAIGNHCPAILRQKFNDLGPYWSEPADDYLTHYPMEDKFLEQGKMDAINGFIESHRYRIVWQNQWFALYLAD